MNEKLVILAKRPIRGSAKTRLAKQIGEDRALEVYRKLLQQTLTLTEHFATTVYWTGGTGQYRDFNSREQCNGDLGQRMAAAFAEQIRSPARVVLVGTDCPGLNEHILTAAFELLKKNNVVLGPALDGGYYLIGMNLMCDTLFEDMPWSTDKVFAKTLSRCRQSGWSVATLPPLGDVDELQDIQSTKDWAWLLE